MSKQEEIILEETGIQIKYKPIAFALVSLLVVFFLYQLVGGGITVYLFGAIPTSDRTLAFRLATMLAEFVFILIPTYFLTRIQTKDWKSFLRFKKTDWYYIVLAVIGVIALQQLLELYLYLQGLIPLPPQIKHIVDALQQTISQTYKVLLTAHNPLEFSIVVLIVAVTPAICEETLFRGLVQSNFEIPMSKKKAMIWTGIIFGAYHLDPFTFVALCVLGIYLSYLVSSTGSILVPMAAHFTNNFLSALVLYVSGKDSIIAPSGSQRLGVGYVIIWSLILAAIFIMTLRLMKNYSQKLWEVKEL
ncbi:MAG: CPBP family intramembrane metalloprotease [Bacteroidetes bacterium]|nr:CPBP family intramembrane metalloprotease [Bacteroidota bacterium]MCL5737523.1 CPBP family intramembrane metalloprotease [Bacteroidota bacterium]